MSRIGKKPIKIPEGVKVNLEEGKITVVGSKGSLTFSLRQEIKVKREADKLLIVTQDNTRLNKSLAGLTRTLIANMIQGVTVGFQKKLELSGVGYRATLVGDELSLSLGFSHPVKFKAPPGITFGVSENQIIVSGIDRQLIGEVAARIRKLKPPEPYKGKGIKYLGEKIRRKAGKAQKAAGVGG